MGSPKYFSISLSISLSDGSMSSGALSIIPILPTEKEVLNTYKHYESRMAYRPSWGQQQSTKDTGWGLIFRLNLLMGKIENDLESGNLEKWNLHIDRIYANILYKNEGEYVRDAKGNIQDINFSREDTEVFSKFAEKIEDIKKKIRKRMTHAQEIGEPAPFYDLKKELYTTIFKKDIWIRKKMFQLKLYLRESESDPRKAIYGG